MRPYVKALQVRKLTATAIDLPKSKAERAVPVFIEKVPAGAVAGGHSYGGRVASMAEVEMRYEALILLSYTKDRTGNAEELRNENRPKIYCPVLLLSGESDPFARVELLRSSARLLRQGQLLTFPGVGHGLLPVVDVAMDRVAEFLRGLRS